MGAMTTLRKAVDVALIEAKNRALGVFDAVENALIDFVDTVTEAAETAAVTIIGTAFNLVETVVEAAFGIAEAAADAALGMAPSDWPGPTDDIPLEDLLKPDREDG